jgi:hypothetical protein
MIKAIDAVEQNRFPSAIRSDDGKDLTFFDFKTDIHQGLDASKCHEDVIDFELNLFRDSHLRALLLKSTCLARQLRIEKAFLF